MFFQNLFFEKIDFVYLFQFIKVLFIYRFNILNLKIYTNNNLALKSDKVK